VPRTSHKFGDRALLLLPELGTDYQWNLHMFHITVHAQTENISIYHRAPELKRKLK